MSRRAVFRTAVLITLGAMLSAVYTLPPATAANTAKQTTVLLAWSGAECVTLTMPDENTGRATTITETSCVAEGLRLTYLSRPGQYYGVKINAAPNVGVVCSVERGQREELFESALSSVDCLRKW